MAKLDEATLESLKTEIFQYYPLDKGVCTIRDIVFGKAEGRKLFGDIYCSIKTPLDSRPAIVFVHGGSWMIGDKRQFVRQASYLAKKFGFFSISIDYRLSEEAKYPAAIHDLKCAIRWVRSQACIYNINTRKVAVCGGSSGAHIAAMAALTEGDNNFEGDGGWKNYSSNIDLCILFNGEYDLIDLAEKHSILEPMRVFLGKTYEEDPILYEKASPIRILNKSMPPTLFLHGTKDTCVSHKQSVQMHEKLTSLGKYSEIELYKGKPHAWFNHLNNYKETLERMEKFIKEQFRLK